MWSHKPHLIQCSSPKRYNAFIKLREVWTLWNAYHRLVMTYVICADSTDKTLSRQRLHISYVFPKTPMIHICFTTTYFSLFLLPMSVLHLSGFCSWPFSIVINGIRAKESFGTIHFCLHRCQHVHKSAVVWTWSHFRAALYQHLSPLGGCIHL